MNSRTLLAAFGTIAGLQTLRALFPLLVYVLKDRLGLPSTALGGVGLLLFAAAFAMPAVVARTGATALPRIALALAAARAALQVWEGDPAISLALSAVGAVTFLAFLAALSRVEMPRERPVTGFLLGAFLDTVIFAFFGTRDLHWHGDLANPVAGGLLGILIVLAFHQLRVSRDEGGETIGAASPLGMLAWGPFLYLQLEVLGNVARMSARSGWETAFSGTCTALGLAWALVLAGTLPRGGLAGAAAGILAAGALALGLRQGEVTGPVAFPTLLLAQVGAAALLGRALPRRDVPRGSAASSVLFGLGFVLFLALFFGHYAGYDLNLPVGRTEILLAAGALLFVASLHPGRPARERRSAALALGLPAMLLALVPLARPTRFPAQDPPPRPASDVVRAVTLNLHQGFDERGDWSFDREMENLRRASPDIVALQEVSRGWVINGGADLYELAREALGLAGVAGPSVARDWGNAVFARWTPTSFENVALPPGSLPIPRAVSVVEVPVPASGPLRVLATHLHHTAADSSVRVGQAKFLASLATDDSRGSVLLGDFNALPESACLAALADAGWTDVVSHGETFPSSAPVRRIDTVLIRGPLHAVRATVAAPWGSDHRAVIADLEPALSR